MRTRRKLFAIFLALSLAPLLLFAVFSYWSGVRSARATLNQRHDRELAQFVGEVNETVNHLQRQLTLLSRSEPLLDYLSSRGESTRASNFFVDNPEMLVTEVSPEARAEIGGVLNSRAHVVSVSLYDNQQRPLLIAQRSKAAPGEPIEFQTRDFIAGNPKPDSRASANAQTVVVNSPAKVTPVGSTTVFTAAVIGGDNQVRGFLVAEVQLDPILAEAAPESSGSESFVVLDRSARILYHSNSAVKNQTVATALPHLTPFAQQMFATESGRNEFEAGDGQTNSGSFTRLRNLDVAAARVSNMDLALANARRNGRLLLLGAILLAILAAAALTFFWRRTSSGIERVTAGVEAIARGDLDQRIDLRSRDDLRPLADNLDVVTKQLREQIARETESQQFQSFVRLSAILTHDLKNSIEALSLTVSNMERHFENAEFRADAMKTLRGATDNLRGLVDRLSNPVTTLSGEHKRPQPVDLVPMLRKVIEKCGVDGQCHVELKLPESLHALVDIERIDKVVENLVINAREAMGTDGGTITIEAGKNSDGKPFFSVTDTGTGMSRHFIEQKLFRPFATTKKRGVGLGLYTCREVVRANGGSIEVASEQGAGTTFVVVLPSPPNR